jgi:hypothetical protein
MIYAFRPEALKTPTDTPKGSTLASKPGRGMGSGIPTYFIEPGRILDPKTQTTNYESRAFIGNCIPGRPPSYVVFQREKVDRKARLQSSVLVVSAGKDKLEETLFEKQLPRLVTTVQLTKTGACREIEGRNRMMSTQKISLNPKREPDPSQDEEEEGPEKESESDRNSEDSSDSPKGLKAD